MKKYIPYITFLLGILIFTFGVSLTIKADIGIGSWDAVSVGLNSMFGISIGFWLIVASLVALIIAAILKKEFIKISSFITAALVGICVDFWVVLTKNINVDTLLKQYIVFFIGIIIVGFGVAVYLLPKLPENPIDHLMVTIKEKYSLKVMNAKLLVDSSCIIIALIFKGPIGIGTILATVILGPAVNFFQDRIIKYYKKLICEEYNEK
ncbi:MAG: YitT family protein [Clostridium sp.]